MKPMNIFLTAGLTITLVSCNPVEVPDNPGTQPVTESLQVDNTVALGSDNRVIYELNLYNFTQAGTLQAAGQRLEELRTLGIDILWLMPVQTRSTQGKIGTLGSPYALHDYTEVNPDHGTLADLQAFVQKAHQLGMEVWLDWVPNHTGLDHVWVTSHPEYYKKQNGQIAHPNNYGDVYQLDYSNTDLQQAMTDAMIYWVRNADIDGFRCDYVSSPEIPGAYWQTAIPAIRAAADGKYIWMLGEADFADKRELYNAGFDYDYAWGFHDQLKNNLGKGSSASAVRTQCTALCNNGNYTLMDRMVYLTNHDDIGNNFSDNYFSYWADNVAPLTVLQFTLYGMPLLYNGQEIGWGKVQNYFNRDVISWSNPDRKLQNTIRTLIALRHTQPALAGGKKVDRPELTWLETDNPAVRAYIKKKGENEVAVVLNFAAEEVKSYVIGQPEGDYEQWLNSATVEQGPAKTTLHLKASEYMTLPAKGYMVYIKK